MQAIFDRIVRAQGDAVVQLGELLAFLGYFTVCLFAGGVAFRESYNAFFQLPVKPRSDIAATATEFAGLALWRGEWFWGFALAFVGLVALFFLCRFVLRFWLGYALLASALCLGLMGAAAAGRAAGSERARSDATREDLTLPVVKLSGAGIEGFDTGAHRLLAQDGDYLFVFEPADVEGEVLQIHALRKKDVARYEVTVK